MKKTTAAAANVNRTQQQSLHHQVKSFDFNSNQQLLFNFSQHMQQLQQSTTSQSINSGSQPQPPQPMLTKSPQLTIKESVSHPNVVQRQKIKSIIPASALMGGGNNNNYDNMLLQQSTKLVKNNQEQKSLKNTNHVDSTHSIKPMFFEQTQNSTGGVSQNPMQVSLQPQKVKKAQKIKLAGGAIGLHKKAISLVPPGHLSQPKSNGESQQLKHSNSKKKISNNTSTIHHSKHNSYGQQQSMPSQQPQLQQHQLQTKLTATMQQKQQPSQQQQSVHHEYSNSSSNNQNNNNIIVMNYGGDVQIFPKIDNFIIGPPPHGGSTPEKVAQQQQNIIKTPEQKKQQIVIDQAHLQNMKNFQRIINEASQSTHPHNSTSHQQQPLHQTKTTTTNQQDAFLKASFDSRPPLGHNGSAISHSTTGHPSQRISIISSSLGGASEEQQHPPQSRVQVHYQAQSHNIQQQKSQHLSVKHQPGKYTFNKQQTTTIDDVREGHETTVLHDSPPPAAKIFVSSGNSQQQRQQMKQGAGMHQRTFSDITSAHHALVHQQMLQLKHQMLLGVDPNLNGGLRLTQPLQDVKQPSLLSCDGAGDNHTQFSGFAQSYDDNIKQSQIGGSQTREEKKHQHRKVVKKSQMQSIDSTTINPSSSLHKTSSIVINHPHHNQLTTLQSSSSRQNHQKHMSEERESLMKMLGSTGHGGKGPRHQVSPSMAATSSEIKSIYQGILKEQIQKTKHALKLTQTNFGAHSRKVVQHKLTGGANTQSFRISQQSSIQPQSSMGGHTITGSGGSTVMMLTSAGLQKAAPKIYLSKTKKHTKQQASINSSQGARGSQNMTKIANPIPSNQVVFLNNEGRLQKLVASGNSRAMEAGTSNKKSMYTGSGGPEVSLNFQGTLADIMARTTTKTGSHMLNNQMNEPISSFQSQNVQKRVSSGGAHKRSVSDGNTIFQSMISNRGANGPPGHHPPMGPSLENTTLQYPPGQIYKLTNGGSGNKKPSHHIRSGTEYHGGNPGILQQEFLKSTYQKESSMAKIAHAPYDQVMIFPSQEAISSSERPMSGGRPGYMLHPSSHRSNQSQNTKLGSHRQVVDPTNNLKSSNTKTSGHFRNLSHQITLDQTNPHHNQQLNNQQHTTSLLPRPPTTSSAKGGGHHSSSHKNSIIGGGKKTRPSKNNNQHNEIVIEDQANNGPPQVMIVSPLSMDEQINSSSRVRKSSKGSAGGAHGKEKLLQIMNKKEKRFSLEQQESTRYNQYERMDTHESAVSDPNLSPRTRKNVKIARKVRLAFQKTGNPPATSSEFYKIGKVMGKGAFGKVNLAIHRLSGKFVALKSINKTFLSEEASKRKVMQEFNILQRTRHRNIVRLYESFETPQHIVFVMEVCGSGDLLTYVRRRRKLKEEVAKHLFKQIVEGLRYCHARGILHRDIKLDNILLTSEGDIKICDFGVSKLVKPGDLLKEQCGTPAYIAPEVFEGQGYEGYASDVWSAGVVLYAMLYGTVPFKASNMTELQRQICKGQTTFKDEISPESIELLKGILEKDPKQRLSIAQILKHPWMQNIPTNINVFTDQEKEKVNSDFAYYNMKGDQNDVGEVLQTDPFAEQMSLNSTQNSLVKNVSTKSIILAPFNSTRTHIDENFYQHDSIQDMMIDKRVIKFAAKVKEIDRQYEANNNAELDNGVYHQEDEDSLPQEEEEKNSKFQNVETKRGSEVNNNIRQDDDQLQREIEEGQKQQKQSEWQKIERMMISNKQRVAAANTTNNAEDDNMAQYQQQQTKLAGKAGATTLVIDQKTIEEIESNGFPRTYIQASLSNDELNYCTAYYYLLQTPKEY